ncbi:hypothetical protein [Brevibacillus brevis]|uniref:hypothetical protein n=1 Tax=Brevibacillus brevis TaxID=1393 RepID=UPI000D101383|nr:hypothetical protein [Brevibacillus brevis]GEC93579.1 hypothetical protein BBR01nite_59100 [Brevibacillus brevis]
MATIRQDGVEHQRRRTTYQDWGRGKGRIIVVLTAIDSLNYPAVWKRSLTDDLAGVMSELPWLMFTMLDRVTEKATT